MCALTDKYGQLRSELDLAYAEPLSNAGRAGRIDQLAEQLIHVEVAIAAATPRDEQTDDSFRGFAW